MVNIYFKILKVIVFVYIKEVHIRGLQEVVE